MNIVRNTEEIRVEGLGNRGTEMCNEVHNLNVKFQDELQDKLGNDIEGLTDKFVEKYESKMEEEKVDYVGVRLFDFRVDRVVSIEGDTGEVHRVFESYIKASNKEELRMALRREIIDLFKLDSVGCYVRTTIIPNEK